MLELSLKRKSTHDLEEVLQMAKDFYALESAVVALRDAQVALRAAAPALEELGGNNEHLSAALHELNGLADDQKIALSALFERFQLTAFGLLEEDLGLKGVRGCTLQVRELFQGVGIRTLALYKYARVDLDTRRFNAHSSAIFFIGKTLGEPGLPTQSRPPSACRAHRYTNREESGRGLDAKFAEV